MTADRARYRAARLAAFGPVPARPERLPARLRPLARAWLAEVADREAAAAAQDRLALLSAALGNSQQAGEAADTAAALRGGFKDPADARRERERRGRADWEAEFGALDDPELAGRIADFQRSIELDELKAREEAGRREASRVSRRARRRTR